MLRTPGPNKKLTEIIDKLGDKKLISCEVNPYKTIDYNILSIINPSFCSIIWIAHPSDSKNPKCLPPLIVSKELIRKGFVVLIHIPAIFYTKEWMKNTLLLLKKYGVRNIFAMRGGGPWLKIENCAFPFALDFIEFIKNEFGDCFDIVTAGFPHIHPASRCMEEEMFFLKQKVLAGASLICTQACMSPQRYFNYRQICTQYAIDIPIIFGLLIFTKFNDFKRIKKMCSSIDTSIYIKAKSARKKNRSKQYGRNWTKEIIEQLLNDDLTVGVHIFTQNHFELAKNILREISADDYKVNMKKI
ncbi:methylenetetrahydrofolate reductase-like [Harmonia axyridis]|uniref:methylenetetrahydrofolate reductase-like n=1 Tax=Harmonia axyridis TaxID=115357 RepID=UPI001E278172|nr:methylenetetrahydrofolate reductase-like [Harmonia axyridis]